MLVETVLRAKGSGVVTTGPEVMVGEAAKLLSAHRIGALVVVDAGSGRVVGVFSERDIVRAMAEHGAKVLDMRVRDLMSTDVAVCSAEDSVESLMATMTNRRIRHLPVVKDGALTGIVTIGDVVKTRLEEATMEVDSLRSYVMDSR